MARQTTMQNPAGLESKAPHSQGLADRLKDATTDLHKIAERTGIISDILRQRTTIDHYLLLLANLTPVYRTMEACISKHSGTHALSNLVQPEIFRYPTLHADINALKAHFSVDAELRVFATTDAYCAHVLASFSSSPAAMLGHIYVRYLGDLNGGQVLQRLIGQSMGIPSSMLSFYAFPSIDDLAKYRETFRRQLDATELTEQDARLAIGVAVDAFKLNIDLSNAVKQYRFDQH
ncbi:MAG: biliverdin-producing heme oxygenase [Woeseiaceae bacterium]